MKPCQPFLRAGSTAVREYLKAQPSTAEVEVFRRLRLLKTWTPPSHDHAINLIASPTIRNGF